MEKKLNIGERFAAMGILPKEGSFLTLRLIRGLVAKLGPSAEELKELDIKPAGDNKISWNSKGGEKIPIEFKEKEVDMIVEELEKLDNAGKLIRDSYQYELYEEMVEGANPAEAK